MKKNTKWLIVVCAVVLMSAVWNYRYIVLNMYWKSTSAAEYTQTALALD